MSLLINIENYEVFYLDYLEGNLSEEETRAFLLFLEENPHLKAEEELTSFVLEENQNLDSKFISELKVFDKTASITAENHENFMIASVENILSATKQIELKDFISKDENYASELAFYHQTKLKADTNIVYSEKSKLRRGIIVPMYIKLVSVAAVLAIIFLAIPNQTEKFDSVKMGSRILPKDHETSTHFDKLSGVSSVSSQKVILSKEEQIFVQKTNDLQPQKIELAEINKMELKKVSPVDFKTENSEVLSLNLSYTVSQNKVLENTDEENSTYLAFEEMKNPAPIVTNTLSQKFKTLVDFRTAKATTKKQGGFYIKIGKLSISRKTGTQDVLAVN
ncbi:MAG: hypothetical protein V4622_13260 [Bacteroidota bacterium]